MKSQRIVTDIETLKGLLASPPSNIHRTLLAIVITNIALIVTGLTTIISDHYTLKNVVVSTIENKQNLEETTKKVLKIEANDINQNYRISKIEDKR